MNFRGTIAYRTNFGGVVPEGFLASIIPAWDFLVREYKTPCIGFNSEGIKIHSPCCEGECGKTANFHFMRGMSCVPEYSAAEIVDNFLGDWVLMLDTDHVFNSDALLEMVQAFEQPHDLDGNALPPLDILVGFTQKRMPPYHPVIYKTDFDALKDFETIFPKNADRYKLLPVDSSGAACLMIRRKVFDKIKYLGEIPFQPRQKFNAAHIEPGFKVQNSLSYDDLPKGRHVYETFGEDTSFFWRAKMLGFQAYCAPWIKFHHIETRIVTEELIMHSRADQVIPK